MRIGDFDFRPRWPFTLLTLVVGVLLCSLGAWQVQRAHEKQAVLDQHAQGRDAAPVELDAAPRDIAGLRYRPVEARGQYLTDRQFLLDNQVNEGQVGYQVLTPLVLAGSETVVLVNRGWVPLGATRAEIPAIGVLGEPRTVLGTANDPPRVGFRMGSGADAGFWPRVIQYADPEELAWVLRRPVLPLVVQLDPEQPDGYLRDWKIVIFGPERHMAYAFQWFSLGAAVLVIYLVLNLRRRRPDDAPDTLDT